MPTPTLTRNQGGLTEKLLGNARLDYVITMPKALFAEQKRTVNTSIFGFTKTPHSVDDEVLFYNLEDDGYKSIQHKGRVDKNNKWNDIENSLLDSINNSKEIAGICQKKKIFNEGILTPSGIQAKRTSTYEMVEISSLFDIAHGTVASDEADEAGDYRLVTASSEFKRHSAYTHDTEAIVYAVAAAGSLGRAHYVSGKFAASNLCLVLTPKDVSDYQLNLEFYNWYFAAIRKQVATDLADGTSKLTIAEPVFRHYYIEYIPIEIQNEIVKKYIQPYAIIENQLSEAENAIKKNIAEIL
jgi:hypothetical protein